MDKVDAEEVKMLTNSGNHGLNPIDKTNSRASTSQDLRSQTSSGNDGEKSVIGIIQFTLYEKRELEEKSVV